jgi:NADH-quinone oxidoreductase subunit N
VVFLLSLAGIPPLFGFVGKILLFGAAMEAGFTWLAVIAILNSVLALAVYLRIIVPMYRPAEPDAVRPPAHQPIVTMTWVIGLGVTLGLGVAAQLLLGWM